MKTRFVVWPIILVLLILIGRQFWVLANPINPSKQTSVTQVPPVGVTLVNGFNYGYSPKEITVKLGGTVKLRLASDDSPHTFTIDELGVDKQFTYGKDTDLEFIASKKGTFQFYCAVPGHKDNGMTGTITVTE